MEIQLISKRESIGKDGERVLLFSFIGGDKDAAVQLTISGQEKQILPYVEKLKVRHTGDTVIVEIKPGAQQKITEG